MLKAQAVSVYSKHKPKAKAKYAAVKLSTT